MSKKSKTVHSPTSGKVSTRGARAGPSMIQAVRATANQKRSNRSDYKKSDRDTNAVKLLLNGPLLNGHPLLRGHYSNFPKFASRIYEMFKQTTGTMVLLVYVGSTVM